MKISLPLSAFALLATSFPISRGELTDSQDDVDAGAEDILSLESNFPVVHLGNYKGDSNIGVSDDIDIALQIVANRHFNGEGPQYWSWPVPDDPEKTVAEAKQLYKRGVRVFVGPETSGQALALAEWAENEASDTLFLTPAATNVELGKRPNIVQFMPPDNKMASAINEVRLMQKRKYVAIIHNDGAYATGLANLIKTNVPQVIEACELTENCFSQEDAGECIELILGASSPEETMVVLLTSGRDTREILRKARAVYSNHGTDEKSILWMGADTVAFDQNLYDKTDTDVWKATRMVNLHGLAAGGGFLSAQDELRARFWNDFALSRNDASPITTDVSPAVLFAADAAGIAYKLAIQGALTGRGADTEKFRLALLHESPFVTMYSGPLRLNNDLQRIDLPYTIVRTKDVEVPTKGLWTTVGYMETAIHEKIKVVGEDGGIVPPLSLEGGAPSRRRLFDVEEPFDTHALNINTSVTNPIDQYMLSLTNQAWDLSGKQDEEVARAMAEIPVIKNLESNLPKEEPIMDFRRRQLKGSRTVKYLTRTVVGTASLAFRPRKFVENQCFRHLETTVIDNQDPVGICASSHGGFILSVLPFPVSEDENVTFDKFLSCNVEKLLDLGREAAKATQDQDCATAQATFANLVGWQALYNYNVCHTSGEEKRTIGRGFDIAESHTFVSGGTVHPAVEVSGLIRTFLREFEDQADAISSEESAKKFAELNLLEEPYVAHVRGEDWLCTCAPQGSNLVCTQMYSMVQCRKDVKSTSECCLTQKDSFTCKASQADCQSELVNYIALRNKELEQNNLMISRNPREDFEGFWDMKDADRQPRHGFWTSLHQCTAEDTLSNFDFPTADPDGKKKSNKKRSKKEAQGALRRLKA